MTNTDIQKIRQLLQKKIVAARNSAGKTDNYLIPLDSRYIISISIQELEQILAFLPCETCGGTGVDGWKDSGSTPVPRPDCQP